MFPVTARDATSRRDRGSTPSRTVTDPHRVVLLGGTTEARRLATALRDRDDVAVVTSLAGRTAHPAPLVGPHRSGGFGGAEGLAAYLRAEGVAALVDATHPFAPQMRWVASDACSRAGVPRLRLERPAWQPREGDRWRVVADVAAAAAAVASSPRRRVFLTIGRGDLGAFARWVDARRSFLIRSIDPPEPMPLEHATLVLERGPFSLDGERALFVRYGIDLLVTKNAGGDATAAKLEAARELNVEVLLIDRPPTPEGPLARGLPDALSWLDTALGCLGASAGPPPPPGRRGGT